MKIVKYILLSLLVCGTVSAKVKVTLQSGVTRDMDSLTVKDGKLLLLPDNTPISLSQVALVEFIFDGFSFEQGQNLFDRGDYTGIIRKLADEKSSLLAAALLQGNTSDWLRMLFRAQFHGGDVAAMRSTVQALRTAGSPLAVEAVPYQILALIDENRIAEATKAFNVLRPPENAAAEFIRARLAVVGGDNKAALQHLARLQAFHYREKEWMPGALFYESLVSKQADMPEAAGFAVRELETLYPASRWCQMAKDQLK